MKKTSLGPRWEIIIAFVVGLVTLIYCLDHFSETTPYYQSKYIAVILLTCYAAFEGPKMLSIDASGIHQKWAGIRYRTVSWTQISQIGLYRYRVGYMPGRTVVFIVINGAPWFDEEKSYQWYSFRHPFRSIVVDFGKNSPEAFEEYVQTFDFQKTI